ncbi:MAG TPA: response regulator transcription factor [Arenimonas sp.]|nr:response regulator transcription factor [Arenimonas sp.]
MTEIALLDDHAILREGIKYLLNKEADLNVCLECGRPSQLVALLAQCVPDVLIVDLNMPEGGGFPLLERLRPEYPALKIIVLSMHESPGFVAKALSYGANGYLTKSKAAEELVLAIRSVMTGNRFLSSDLAGRLDGKQVQLSAREIDALKGILQGKTPKALAAELGITDKTLYAHRANIMQKLEARTLAELQERAISLGLA